MSPIVAIWVLSLIGALLFFLAGLLSGRRVPGAREASAADAKRIEALEAALADKTRRLSASEEELIEVSGRLGAVRSQMEALEERSHQVSSTAAQLREQLQARELAVEQLRGERRVPTFTVVPTGASVGRKTLDEIVLGFAGAEGVRTVAVADDLGLPLSGSGDHVESLAAFCGLVAEIEAKARKLLPIGCVRRITLETDYDATVSACPLSGHDFQVALATLTVGPPPDTRRLTEALEEVAAAIA